jgi:hypothetical protein
LCFNSVLAIVTMGVLDWMESKRMQIGMRTTRARRARDRRSTQVE